MKPARWLAAWLALGRKDNQGWLGPWLPRQHREGVADTSALRQRRPTFPASDFVTRPMASMQPRATTESHRTFPVSDFVTRPMASV